MIPPTPIEGLIIFLLLLTIFRIFGWTISIQKNKCSSENEEEENKNIIFHPQGPQGAYFEIPDGVDPASLKELFAEASRELVNHHKEHSKPEAGQEAPGGYV